MKIVLIGTGNVAMHLGPALVKAGHKLVQVVGRTEKHSKFLANKLDCDFTIEKEKIYAKADAYIIALRDEAIGHYVKHIPSEAKLVVHTSGSVSSKILATSTKHFGVLYPLQTFSFDRKIDFNGLPFFKQSQMNIFNVALFNEDADAFLSWDCEVKKQWILENTNQKTQSTL